VCLLQLRILHFSTRASAFLIFAYYTAVLTSWMTAGDAPAGIKERTQITKLIVCLAIVQYIDSHILSYIV
jgi:hypothetical protein